MKSPTAESSLKLIHAVDGLLKCAELRGCNVSETTHQAIDGVLETAAQVQRECNFPDRTDIVRFFANRFAQEDREALLKRIVVLASTLPNEVLYASYQEICEETPVSERGKIRRE